MLSEKEDFCSRLQQRMMLRCLYVHGLRMGTCPAGMRQNTSRKLRSVVMSVNFNFLWIFCVVHGGGLVLVLI